LAGLGGINQMFLQAAEFLLKAGWNGSFTTILLPLVGGGFTFFVRGLV
jgi:hypothetical protein